MKYNDNDQMKFMLEMSEHQIGAQEFFCTILLDSLRRNFELNNVLILYFDTHGKFLSWIGKNGILVNCDGHPYASFADRDPVRKLAYSDAVRDKLDYFNTTPRLYCSSEVIGRTDYDSSEYVKFLEENFGAHYSVTMAYGINAYIMVTCLKDSEEGDFSENELHGLERIYTFVANAYKNFKKYEQAKIVSDIQSRIISSGEKAYLVTDDFMHVMSCNKEAREYLSDILGPSVSEQLTGSEPCSWLPFLLGGDDENQPGAVNIRYIKSYVFKIYTYDQGYTNGIIDRYHWITISEKNDSKETAKSDQMELGIDDIDDVLTSAEKKVAWLMYKGLTYQEVADQLTVSYHTVKKHVQNIYIKCNVNSRYELYKWIEKHSR